jgi:hypothetical protein
MIKKFLWTWILVVALCVSGYASEKLHEKDYQKIWCDMNSGQIEVVMVDSTRCDCLTDTHAIEFDFGKKWAEAIGQSLNYSRLTNRRAGIVLIIKMDEMRYWERMNAIIKHFDLPIDTWIMTK